LEEVRTARKCAGNRYRDLLIVGDKMSRLSTKFLELMRTTLARVKEQTGIPSDDPALLELKRSVVQKVAALEVLESDVAVAPSGTEGVETGLPATGTAA